MSETSCLDFFPSSQKLNVLAFVLTWIEYASLQFRSVAKMSAPIALLEVGDAIKPILHIALMLPDIHRASR